MNKIARVWLLQSLHDLDMAEKNLTISGYDVAAFLSHQAVEKLLKALLAARGEKIPKIHFLDVLTRNLSLDEDIYTDLLELSADYILTRYPALSESMPFEQYTLQIASEKVSTARKIFARLEPEYRGILEDT